MKQLILFSFLVQTVFSKPFILYKKDSLSAHQMVKRDSVGLSSNETYIQGTSFFMVDHDSDLDSLKKRFPSYVVEEDKVATINLEWHVDRVDQTSLPLNDKFTGSTFNSDNVDVYIFDTGVETTHQEFSTGQARWGANFVDTIDSDCHGHGTHVASTVAGVNVGVAKGAKIIAVKVLGCSGSGSYSGIIQGISWVVSEYQRTGRLSIINMSLGGGISDALTAAIREAFNAGVYFVVAAGNSNDNACNYSPSNAPEAITVAATDSSDAKAGFSNWGSCVDVYAPGACLWAAYPGNTYTSMCGTSMASPMAAGVLATYISKLGRDGYNTFRSSMSDNVVSGNPSGTPNKFVYLNSQLLSTPPPTSTTPTPPSSTTSGSPNPTSTCVPTTVTSTATSTFTSTLTSTTSLTRTTTLTRTLTRTTTVTAPCSSPTQVPTSGCYNSARTYFVSKTGISYDNAQILCPSGMKFVGVNSTNTETIRQLVVSCNGISSSWIKTWNGSGGSGNCLKSYSTKTTIRAFISVCSYRFPVVCSV